jgi:hypothetical protein
MSDSLWIVLMTVLVLGAAREFLNAWFLHQCGKRNREL